MKKRIALLILPPLVLTATVIGVALASRSPQGLMRQLERSTPERTFAARLSIDTEYSRCTAQPPKGGETLRPEECAGAGEGPLSQRELMAAAKSSHPDSLQAYGLATLIWRDDKESSLDAAILRLETALRLSPGSVALRVDLSAAHLVRAERTWNPRDLFQALQYAGEALAREPRNAAALFNAALALQWFGLDWAADDAWHRYLAVDSTSEWASEARERKGLLTDVPEIARPTAGAPDSGVRGFAAAYPQEARELGWDHVLGQWGAAVQAEDTARAASLLDLADRLGQALEQRRGGDASLAEAVRAIRAVESNAVARMALARGHQAYAEGMAAVHRAEYPEAAKAFARVIRNRPPSPVLLQWAEAFLAAVDLAQPNDEKQRVLRRLLPQVDSTYPALAGRVRKAMARSLFSGGMYQEAREQSSAGGRLLLSAGEMEFSGDLLSLEGESAYELGDTAGAYQLLHRAQLRLRPYAGSQAAHNQLTALGKRALQDELPHAALLIYDESVHAAMRRPLPPVSVVEVLRYRAEARAIVGDSLGSQHDLDSAFAWSRKLPPDHDQRIWADAMMTMARSGTPSIAAMDSAVDALSGRVVWLIPALLWRADAWLARGNLSAAIRDLDSVTAIIHGSEPSQIWLRAAMMEQARSRFDQLVMLHLWQGQPRNALRVLEAGRVPLRPRRDGARAGSPGRLPRPRGYNAVDYALIGDTLLAWLVLPESTELFRTPVDRDTFRLTVERVGAALESGAPAGAVRPDLRRLYDWLIRPMRERLRPSETPLVIVADGEVASVPFEALWDRERGRYLVQDHLLVHAPTLADARPPSRGRGQGPALLVANPRFDLLAYPALDSLPGAEEEVDSLRTFYPGAGVLRGATATRDPFVALARGAGLIHYAGHAMFDDARPERSFLLLADAGATGRLTVQAVDSMELRGNPLVVLSACRTLRSSTGRSGGFAGLSGALLEAGASGVVGSLWRADDQLTQPLMLAFHRHYQQMDAARALRAAQLRMIDLQRSPAAWAGFRYMGS